MENILRNLPIVILVLDPKNIYKQIILLLRNECYAEEEQIGRNKNNTCVKMRNFPANKEI